MTRTRAPPPRRLQWSNLIVSRIECKEVLDNADIIKLKDTAAQAEYEAILQVLKQVNFNKSKAAEILNIDRKTLYNKIKTYESQ